MKKLIALALVTATAANAATISYTNYVAWNANYTADVFIPQFNPALGNLRSVVAQAQIIESRTFAGENRGAGDQLFSFNMTNTVTLNIPGATDPSANVYSSITPVRRLTRPFDGVVDYAGASGFTFPYNTTNSIPVALTSIVPFAGYSVIPVQVSAAGNLGWSFSTTSFSSYTKDVIEVRIYVSYTFDPAVLN